jgi:TPR repeat protein
MKASFWALLFSVLLGASAQTQQSASPPATNSLTTNAPFKPPSPDTLVEFPSATNSLGTNTPTKIAELRAKAEKGDAAAQIYLGYNYYHGDGVPQNYAEAVKWYRKAAEQGNATGQLDLGLMYEMGLGAKLDYFKAPYWYRKAADQGLVEAEAMLARLYTFGLGVRQDYAEAEKWFRKAAEDGNAYSQAMLGDAYHSGKGVVTDFAEAVKWYRRAADQGDTEAQYDLAIEYWRGEGTPRNDIEAYKWLSLAAAQGFAESAIQRDSLAQSMSRAEIVEGQRLASEFVARKEGGGSNPRYEQDSVLVGNMPRATGTGFFVTVDGYLLTCYPVVQDAGRIAVRTTAGTFAAKLVKSDKANDVALLKVAGKFAALPVGLSRGVKLGESVFTIGFPNIELQGFAPKLTKGEISSLTGMQDDPREFQISVAVQPGNSGGPLVNQYGNVVGIVAAQLADIATLETTGSLPQNVNYAVKSSVLNVLLESLPEISAKLPEPNPIKDRKFDDVVKDAEGAVALVMVY